MADAIALLRQAGTIGEQVAAIRQLKSAAVGHENRKKEIVRHGGNHLLVGTISSAAREVGRQDNGTAQLSSGDDLRLQATLALATLVHGGTAIFQPLVAGQAITALLDSLQVGGAPRVVTATLQALKNVAAVWFTGLSGEIPGWPQELPLFTESTIPVFRDLLHQPATSTTGRQQLQLLIEIISMASKCVETRKLLVKNRFLDALAALLVSHSIAQRHVDYYGETAHLPPPPPTVVVPTILSAVWMIIHDSVYRTHRFFLSSAIQDLFLPSWATSAEHRAMYGPKAGFSAVNGDPQLPQLHIPSNGTLSYDKILRSSSLAMVQSGAGAEVTPKTCDVDHVNAVCSWLILLARSMDGSDRLSALHVLAAVNHAVEANARGMSHRSEYLQKAKERKTQMSLLAIPLVVRLITTAVETRVAPPERRAQKDLRLIRENACTVLALLVSESEDFQQVAVQGGAIKQVCAMAKKTFDAITLSRVMWSPPTDAPMNDSPSCTLGDEGLPYEVLHTMRCRRGALLAIAALAEVDEKHRGAIMETGIVPSIVSALTPFPAEPPRKPNVAGAQLTSKDGNTIAVVLAACEAIRSLSRSVSLLRTTLIDAGIAKPIFQLLQHPSPEVQLAATDVCVNLCIDFSPMREDLIAEGVVKTLCDHARRSSPELRFSSVWALKHLVTTAPAHVKMNVLEELGPGWLVSTIQGEQRDMGPQTGGGVSIGLSTANAAGEQVDLLNPSSMDLDDPIEEETDIRDEDGEIMFDESSSTHYQSSQLRSTLQPTPPSFSTKRYLSSIRDAEQNPLVKARRDEIAIQEQALDLMRNFLTIDGDDDCAPMLDHLFQQIGSTKIFELVTEKLTPLPYTKAGNNNNHRPIYRPTKLIHAAIQLLCHMSNSAPRHKQLLIAQRPLLQAWLPHFSHPDGRVRVACLWAVTSLTWMVDESDRRDARQRAAELRSVGIEGVCRGLLGDGELDVKERAKTVVRQFDQL